MSWETVLAVLAGVASTRAYMWLTGYRRTSQTVLRPTNGEDH